MANFTVNTGATDTGAKTVGNNDTGTIQAGGTLSDTTDISWTGGSAAPGVIINNSGTITATTRGIDTSGAFTTGSFSLNNDAGARLIASGNDAFRINTNITLGTIGVNNSGLLVSGAVDAGGHVIADASGQALDFAAIVSQTAVINITNNTGATIGASGDDAIRPGAGHIDIENSGLIDATPSASRAINLNTSSLSNIVSFTLNNHAGGTIQSQGDAVRITATTLTGNPAGTFLLDNAGTIQSTGAGNNNGQAIDFNDLASTNAHVTITNEATGLIQAADADAVRAGTNATVNNFGTIRSLNGTPTSTGNDGLDFQANTGGIVNNGDASHTTALISGARHGITGDNPVTVTNYGAIIGNSGSGINLDTFKTTTATITNYGSITGTSVTADGDGVDVDGLIALNNYGTIAATGVHIVVFDPITNQPVVELQEAVTIGGGTINNYAGGKIVSFERAITVDDSGGGGGPNGINGSNGGNAWAPTVIYNEGTIEGDNGQAISITDTFADTITNKGVIIGSVMTGGGDDVVNEYGGSSLSGLLDGGDGNDTVNLLGNGTGTLSSVANVEFLHVEGGNWTITDNESFTAGTTIDAGAALQIGSGGTTGALTGDVTDNGVLAFDHSDNITFGNSISGSGSVVQAGSGVLALGGHNSYSSGTELAAGTLDVMATDSAGTGAITLDAGAQTLQIELTALSAGHFANVIAGFAAGDIIDLAGAGLATSATLGAGNVLVVIGGGIGPITLQLDPGQSFANDVFKVVSDGAGGTDITVAPDQAPVAQDGSASGDEDHVITGHAVATDPDNLPAPLSYSLVNGPQHGQLSFNSDGSFSYTPDHDFNGTDSFSFRANDGLLDSNIATVGLTINAVNDAPNFTTPAHFAVAEDSTAVGTVMAVDPEHNAFLFSVTGGDDASFFTIDAHTGALSFRNSPDFETPEDANHDNVYDVIVSATDTFGAANAQDIKVGVTNLAEPGRSINGGNGDDALLGTAGNDTISGGNGDDRIDGGDGNDVISGGNGNDVLIGGRGNNTLDGGNGNDTLTAANGNNSLDGGNGNDILKAGAGNDILTGGNGDDIVNGGGGNDVLSGGNGNDSFVFAANLGKDTVTDFSHGDTIEFDGVFHDFQAVMAATHQVGADTVITVAANDSVTLQHVSLASLHVSDFHLV